MRTYQIYSAGRFISTQHPHKVINKYSGELFAQTFLSDEKLLNETIEMAVRAKKNCADLSSFEKAEALNFIANQLDKGRTELARILAIESAKPIRYALAEIDRAVQTFTIAAEECKRLPAEYLSLDWTSSGKGREGLVKYFPIGVVAGISPFNFPLNLACHKIAPAIATGCPIILKPSSTTPLSTLELALIIDQTKLPKGAVSILPMDRTTGNKLVTHENINLLSFTGSPSIGWELKKQSGKKKVILELGGNAGVIVASGARLKDIVSKCLVGAFAYSGQICIHAQRFYVHDTLFDEFCSQMKSGAEKLITGDPLDEKTEVSVMIDEDNAVRIEKWLDEAKKAGAKILCGGERKNNFVSPAILTDTIIHMKVNAEEVFGPVICIEKYSGGISNAVEKINEGKFGLQCGVFTDSIAELDYCFKHIEVGGVIHNDTPLLRFDQMPYGGIKESGLGREGVRYAIQDMLEARVLVK